MIGFKRQYVSTPDGLFLKLQSPVDFTHAVVRVLTDEHGASDYSLAGAFGTWDAAENYQNDLYLSGDGPTIIAPVLSLDAYAAELRRRADAATAEAPAPVTAAGLIAQVAAAAQAADQARDAADRAGTSGAQGAEVDMDCLVPGLDITFAQAAAGREVMVAAAAEMAEVAEARRARAAARADRHDGRTTRALLDPRHVAAPPSAIDAMDTMVRAANLVFLAGADADGQAARADARRVKELRRASRNATVSVPLPAPRVTVCRERDADGVRELRTGRGKAARCVGYLGPVMQATASGRPRRAAWCATDAATGTSYSARTQREAVAALAAALGA